MIYGIYRQWQVPSSDKIYNTSLLVSQQESRWKVNINKMSETLETNIETYIIGDIHLNTISFDKNWNEKTKHQRNMSNMYDDTKFLIDKF